MRTDKGDSIEISASIRARPRMQHATITVVIRTATGKRVAICLYADEAEQLRNALLRAELEASDLEDKRIIEG